MEDGTKQSALIRLVSAVIISALSFSGQVQYLTGGGGPNAGSLAGTRESDLGGGSPAGPQDLPSVQVSDEGGSPHLGQPLPSCHPTGSTTSLLTARVTLTDGSAHGPG